jgi:hypothetical protein
VIDKVRARLSYRRRRGDARVRAVGDLHREVGLESRGTPTLRSSSSSAYSCSAAGGEEDDSRQMRTATRGEMRRDRSAHVDDELLISDLQSSTPPLLAPIFTPKGKALGKVAGSCRSSRPPHSARASRPSARLVDPDNAFAPLSPCLTSLLLSESRLPICVFQRCR